VGPAHEALSEESDAQLRFHCAFMPKNKQEIKGSGDDYCNS